jgi:type IV pilus assembly protein PilB
MSTGNHWLKDVAGHAGLQLDLPSQPEIAEIRRAWPVVARACRMPEDTFTQRAASHFRIAVADFSVTDPQAVRLVPEAVARKYGILAISATDTSITIATSDPANRAAQREIVACSSRQPVFLMATPSTLSQALERAYSPSHSSPRNTLQTLVAQVADSEGTFQVTSSTGRGLFTSFEIEDPPVVKLADLVLQQAIRHRSTEIHIEPGPRQGRVRYRIDGVLQQVVDLPPTAHNRLVARLKHMARPQQGASGEDGFAIVAGDVSRQAHLMTTPTPDGELVLIRLLAPAVVPSLDDLSFTGPERAKIDVLLQRREGLVLVTGPARSGITSFVYATLDSFRGQSVISIEGRPELVVPGVTQIRYDASAGVPFAEALQQLMDRKPDVLHAGEIRDLATARIVLRIAVTGRKVVATVHTSDAVSGVRRLIDMGLAPGRLAESLHAVVSLRLIRKLCEKCARPFDPAKDAKSREAKLAAALGVKPGKMAVGCRVCAGTGFLNQIPIPEVLVVSPAMRAALSGNPGDADLLRAARADGMRTFAEIGRDRVTKGETTVEEIERVLGVVPTREESAGSVGPVLIVEDEPEDMLLLATVLRSMGFTVFEAADVGTAQQHLDSGEAFSLALIDLSLQGKDGRMVLKSIRSQLTTQSLPTIIVTGSENPRHEVDLLEAGADDYIRKPVAIDQLQARVRAVLRRTGVKLAGPGASTGAGATTAPSSSHAPKPIAATRPVSGGTRG